MVMWKAKRCPKCSGDLFLDIDGNIWFNHCLQCGYTSPRTNVNCPYCSLEMLIDSYKDSKFYNCIGCGYVSEIQEVTNNP